MLALSSVGALAAWPAWGQTAMSMEDVRALVRARDHARLRELLEREPPSGPIEAVSAFHAQQVVIARSLGLPDRQLAWLRSWMNAMPAGRLQDAPKIALWRTLAMSDRLAEADELGEQVLAEALAGHVDPPFALRNVAWRALDQVRLGRWAAAELLLERIRPSVRSLWGAGPTAFWVAYARATFHRADAALLAARGRHDDAAMAWRQSLEMDDQQLRYLQRVPGYEQEQALERIANERLTVASSLADLGRFVEAEELLQRAAQIARDARLDHRVMEARLKHRRAQMLLAQQRLGAARDMAESTLALATTIEQGRPGALTRAAHEVRVRVLIAQQDWPAALAAFEAIDQLTQGNTAVAAAMRFPVARSLAYLFNGRAQAAVAGADALVHQRQRAMGETHLDTMLARGLRGMVLAGLGDDAQPQARTDLAAAAAALAEPLTPGHDLVARGDRSTLKALILKRHLELSSQYGASAQAFAASELLRDSGVQRALVDAATRSAASVAGLSELVRRDQDAMHELHGLYEFLAQQSDTPDALQASDRTQPLRQRVMALETLRTELLAELHARFPQYERLARPGPISPADVSAHLRQGEALLALLPQDDGVYAWLIRAGAEVEAKRLPVTAPVLGGWVAEVRRTTINNGQGPPTFASAAARQLYAGLLAPFEHSLRDVHHLIVGTSGVLGQLPFAALVTSPGDSPATYLIDRLAVSHAPSATAWLAARVRPKSLASEPMLGWGDPLFDSSASAGASAAVRRLELARSRQESVDASPPSSLRYSAIPPLPETRDELNAIATALKADPAKDLMLGARATLESVMAASRSGALSRQRLVAFATHGLMAQDLPQLDQPALAMAATPASELDPLAALLKLEHVLNLKLDADWVLLSACNTAAADGRSGEALSGLARGFFYAGARSLLVTHWAVETESAALLSAATFEHHARYPEHARAEALRQAALQVKAMPRFAHPAYWAAYALVGDGGR